MHVLTSGRLHPATSRAPLLPLPLLHGACPPPAHLLTQQAWDQFTNDQKHEMCFKVPQCHPVERKGAQHNVYSSGLKWGLESSSPTSPTSPSPMTSPFCPAELAWDTGERRWLDECEEASGEVGHRETPPPPQPVTGSSFLQSVPGEMFLLC